MRPGCKFCDKAGLPIFLTRYAIAPKIAQTAKLPDNLKPKLKTAHGDAGKDAPDMGSTCGYTLRSVRPGYVYQYDENAKFWTAYKVMDGGYLYQLSLDPHNPDPNDPKQQSDLPEAFSCFSSTVDSSLATIITIPNPEKAGHVWFAYAEVLWTKNIFVKHQALPNRKKNMRLFDVAGWRASHTDVKNATSIDDVSKVVAEYQLTEAQAASGFSWSQFGFHLKDKAATSNLISNCQNLVKDKKYPPAILGLDDPTGMMQELAQLMDLRLTAFQKAPARRRKLAAAGAITQLKRAVKESVEGKILKAARSRQDEVVTLYGMSAENRVLWRNDPNGKTSDPDTNRETEMSYMYPDYRKRYEELGKVKEEELDQAVNKEWDKKYKNRFDESSKNTFDSDYAKDLNAFDNAHILPLAKAHATIFADPMTVIYFEANHDRKNINTGVAYLYTITNCVKNTQDKMPCSIELEKQLKAEPGKPESLIMNSFTMNNDELLEKIKEGINPKIEILHIPWSALTDSFKMSIGAAESAEQTVAVKLAKILVMQLAAPIMSVLDQTIEAQVKTHLPAILGMMSHAPVVKVEITGERRQFVKHMVKQLMLISGKDMDKATMATAVSQEIKRLGIRGVDMKGSTTKTFAILVDEDMLDKMKTKEGKEALMKMKLEDRAKYVTESFKLPEQLDELNIKATVEKLKAPSGEVIVTGVSLLLQWLIVGKLDDDITSSLKDGKDEARWRYGAGCIQFGAFVGEAVESLFEGMIKLNFKWIGILKNIKLAGSIVGKLAGVAAGAILAVFDALAAIDAYKKEEYGMMFLYGISSASGILVAVIFAMCEVIPVIGWILLAILLVVTVLIEIFHDNNMQLWLEKCIWGREDKKYSEADEMSEFKVAMEG